MYVLMVMGFPNVCSDGDFLMYVLMVMGIS